ncbi:DUF499 domain-containing protein [Nonomuraea sp. NPDC005983]|uniref:DUF499 domain-containing protein n=1 Tax=Nonomuraea sp. NPDC005983 TaxID=3155595 RepID=UPI0033A631DF
MVEVESTRWWRTLRLRSEIIDASGVVDDTRVSLYHVVYGKGSSKPPYASASYYGKITHPTEQLTELLTKIAIRLGGGAKADHGIKLVRLDQGMGGGKSHACIGAWHLATAPEELAGEDIGREAFRRARAELGEDLPVDLNRPHVVVLSCDNMTPAPATDAEQDGPWAFNLYERFLWRLFANRADRDELYDSYKPYFSNKAKISEAIEALGRPVLIIVDEIINYIGDGLEATGNAQLIAQDMAFLRAITDAVGDVPNAAMIVVMISSEKDPTALRGDGEARRQDLDAYLQRNGDTMAVNENADFSAILRRRLFDPVPNQILNNTVAATVEAFTPVLDQGSWQSKVLGVLHAAWTKRFATEVERTFPFHPQLMDIAEKEWANLTGYQQVRSTIKIFAATVHSLSARAAAGEWTPLLIGPGDVPLSDAGVRDAVISSGLISHSKARGNYRSIAQNDIVDLEDRAGAARYLDLTRADAPWQASNPRAAERAATMIYLASIVGARGGSRRGATDPEVKAATMVPEPDYGYNEADAVVRALTDVDGSGLASLEIFEGRGGQPRRYYLSTQQRLPMLVRAMRNTVTEDDRDKAVARCADARLSKSRGPFAKVRFIYAEAGQPHREVLVRAELEEARTTRLVALDPAMFTIGNGTQKPTIESVRAILGLGPDKVPTTWASSLVFIVFAARHRTLARRAAADFLAYELVLNGPEVEGDEELAIQAVQARDAAQRRLEDYVARGFQHVLYLAQPDPTMERDLEQRNLDEGTLDGAKIWDLLAKAQKAFPPGRFTGRALLHNLRDSDYDRPLSEIRDAFWNTPRLGLLPSGDADLRQAVYQAVQDGELRIVRAGGEEVVVDDLTGINFNAPTYRLAKPDLKPKPEEGQKPEPQPGGGGTDTDRPGPPGGGTTNGRAGGTDTGSGGSSGGPSPEQMLMFTVMKNLASAPDAADRLAQIFRRLFDALDRGNMSYLSLTIQAQLPSEQAREIGLLAEELGIKVNIRNR